jgi:hypothetical protein
MKTQIISHKTTFLSKEQKRELRDNYVNSIGNRCGLIVSATLVAFFLIMRAFNLHEMLVLRYFNFVILAGGIIGAFLSYKRKFGYKGIRYFPGIKMGAHVCLVAMVPFAIFMGIYLAVDTSFMEYIRENAAFGKYLTPARAAGGLFMEAFATGVVLTLSLMQFFKDEEFNPNYEK